MATLTLYDFPDDGAGFRGVADVIDFLALGNEAGAVELTDLEDVALTPDRFAYSAAVEAPGVTPTRLVYEFTAAPGEDGVETLFEGNATRGFTGTIGTMRVFEEGAAIYAVTGLSIELADFLANAVPDPFAESDEVGFDLDGDGALPAALDLGVVAAVGPVAPDADDAPDRVVAAEGLATGGLVAGAGAYRYGVAEAGDLLLRPAAELAAAGDALPDDLPEAGARAAGFETFVFGPDALGFEGGASAGTLLALPPVLRPGLEVPGIVAVEDAGGALPVAEFLAAFSAQQLDAAGAEAALSLEAVEGAALAGGEIRVGPAEIDLPQDVTAEVATFTATVSDGLDRSADLAATGAIVATGVNDPVVLSGGGPIAAADDGAAVDARLDLAFADPDIDPAGLLSDTHRAEITPLAATAFGTLQQVATIAPPALGAGGAEPGTLPLAFVAGPGELAPIPAGDAPFTQDFEVALTEELAAPGMDGETSAVTVTVAVTGRDDAPELATTPLAPEFTEAAPDAEAVPVALFEATTIDTVDLLDPAAADAARQPVVRLLLTVEGVPAENPSGEALVVDGTDIPLAPGTVALPGLGAGAAATVTATASGLSVDLSGLALAPAAADALVDGLGYVARGSLPAVEDNTRTVTLAEITDSGRDDGANANTLAAGAAATVTLIGENDPPVAEDDGVDPPLAATAGEAAVLDVLANDVDPEGAALAIAEIDLAPADGTATVVALPGGGEAIEFTPGARFDALLEDEAEDISFAYTVADPEGAEDTATVFLRVAGGGDLPVLSILDTAAEEGNVAADDRRLEFPVSLSEPRADREVSFTVTATDGTATGGVDYTGVASAVFTIPAGQTGIIVPVDIVEDLIPEDDETLFLTLSAPDGAALGRAVATGTILDDDGAGFVDTPEADPLGDPLGFVLGSEDDDTLTLLNDGQDDRFDAAGGIDTLDLTGITAGIGRYDVELAAGGSGAGIVTASGTDTIVDFEVVEGSQNPETMTGTSSSDTLRGNGGDDSFNGLGGDDVIEGGAGNDLVDGSLEGGNDLISGGPGDDRLDGGDGLDTVTGDAGDDEITDSGGIEADTLDGGEGADRVAGGRGSDVAIGGAGNDTVLGGPGADTLFGNAGANRLSGEAGFDIFAIDADGAATDIVTDFQPSEFLVFRSGLEGANVSGGAVVQDTTPFGEAVIVSGPGFTENSGTFHQVRTLDANEEIALDNGVNVLGSGIGTALPVAVGLRQVVFEDTFNGEAALVVQAAPSLGGVAVYRVEPDPADPDAIGSVETVAVLEGVSDTALLLEATFPGFRAGFVEQDDVPPPPPPPTPPVIPPDTLAPTPSPGEVVTGTDGDDVFAGVPNGAVIDTGAGTDTVSYPLAREALALAATGDGALTATGPDGRADRLENVERVALEDGTWLLGLGPEAAEVHRLFAAAYDRLPAETGLLHWTQARADGMSRADLAGAFLESGELAALLGADPAPETLVTALYDTVLDRAPGPDGLAHWTGRLEAGMSEADLLSAFAFGDENLANTADDLDPGVWVTG